MMATLSESQPEKQKSKTYGIVIIGPRCEKTSGFKSVSSATSNSLKIEISLVASLDMILSKKRITMALISLGGCCSQTTEDRFSRVKAHIKRVS